ncbi:hypothetical protein [Flammeovirga pacifica]|nr:hypothetical protein [Flammeovirga pacifica]
MKSKKEQLEELEKEYEKHLKSLDNETLPSLKKQQKFVKIAKELEEKIKILKG